MARSASFSFLRWGNGLPQRHGRGPPPPARTPTGHARLVTHQKEAQIRCADTELGPRRCLTRPFPACYTITGGRSDLWTHPRAPGVLASYIRTCRSLVEYLARDRRC